jgi:hypothetical protein
VTNVTVDAGLGCNNYVGVRAFFCGSKKKRQIILALKNSDSNY